MVRVRRLVAAACFAGVLGCSAAVDIDNVPVAKIDGEPIRLRDLVARISQMPAESRLQVATIDGRKKILEDLINETLLLQEADRQGITVTDEEVFARPELGQIQSDPDTPGGRAVPTVRDLTSNRRRIIMERVVAPYLSEDKVRARYEQALTEGRPIPAVQYDFLWVRAAYPDFAKEIRRRVEGGANIVDLVRQLQQHPAVINGGRTKINPATSFEPWLREKLLALQPGQLVEPYMTERDGERGIMFVRLVGRWDTLPIQMVYDDVVTELYREYVARLKSQHTIERFPQNLALFERR